MTGRAVRPKGRARRSRAMWPCLTPGALSTAWARWRDAAGSVALNFMDREDLGVMAAQYQMRAMEQGLSVAGVDRMCQWAAPQLDQPTDLAYLARYEKAAPYVLDVAAGAWKPRPAVPPNVTPAMAPALGGPPQQPPRQHHPPAETPEQEEILRLADGIRELQMLPWATVRVVMPKEFQQKSTECSPCGGLEVMSLNCGGRTTTTGHSPSPYEGGPRAQSWAGRARSGTLGSLQRSARSSSRLMPCRSTLSAKRPWASKLAPSTV